MITYLITGVIAGILSGLLGIGGGIVIVPTLSFVLLHANIPEPIAVHMAVATSLGCLLITAISSTYIHHRHQHIDWRLVFKAAPFFIISVFIGTTLSTYIPSHLLIIVVVLALLFAAYQLFRATLHQSQRQRELPKIPWYILACSGFSTVGSMVGFGGGIFLVPYLNRYGLSIRHAAGTSSACNVIISLFGMLNYMHLGTHLDTNISAWHTSYIYWPAFFGIILTSIWCAPLGVLLAKRLPSLIIKRIFALLLVIVAMKLLILTG